MRERFEQQMEILHTELIELGALCEQAIGRTYEVLLEGHQRAAEEIIKKDQVVDAKEREIEDLCFRIILQQQPVARDLRQVSAALKMITDMERIGDQAADIADIVKVTSLGVPDASIRLKAMGLEFDEDEMIERVRNTSINSPEGRTSIYADLKAGRLTEVNTISGAVVKAGDRLGVPVPSHKMIVNMVHAMEDKSKNNVQ